MGNNHTIGEVKMAASLTESLRTAIINSGLSKYRLARMTGIDANNISRFLKGTRGICLSTAEKLAEAVGFEVK
jgi:plasmid maintenance system antidote protein VapI